MKEMKSLSYDLPVRIFHSLFALFFILSFSIAKFVDDESKIYAFHMIGGIMMTGLVVLRIVWGLIGSKTAQFKNFNLRPSALFNYLQSVIFGHSERYLGHNPASSIVSVIMMIFTLTLFVTGLLMVNSVSKHFFEEIHEVAANLFLVSTIIHILGVMIHQMKHKDGIFMSMITGYKKGFFKEQSIDSHHSASGLAMLIVFCLFSLQILYSFDYQGQQLDLFSYKLQLGEKEHGNHGHDHGKYESEEHENDDD